MPHSVELITILSQAREEYFYTMPMHLAGAIEAGDTIAQLVDGKYAKRWTNSMMLTREQLLAGHGRTATVGLRLTEKGEALYQRLLSSRR